MLVERMSEMLYPAHILYLDDGTQKIQTVAEHCRGCAEIASEHLTRVSLWRAGYLAGLLHDMGKYTSDYKDYLNRAVAGECVRVGSVVHTHGAVRFLLEEYHDSKAFTSFQDMTAEILAYAAGAHHGLYDCVNQQHQSGFSHRIGWDERLYREAKEEFLCQCAEKQEIQQLFEQAHEQLLPVYQWANTNTSGDDREIFFYLGLLSRLILSSVIQGDREDTARFMNGTDFPADKLKVSSSMWQGLLDRVEEKLKHFPQETQIQKARGRISELCKEAGRMPGGIYQLHVPTGGGKTLSSLRYALVHSANQGKSRIIFTSPLLSILEQNAEVIRSFLEDDTLVLEHHSNLIQERSESGELDPKELMMESWDASIIITTLVQLLNTLFSGKTSCIRRFQALCNCVLVIDEVQTVPPKMLTLFNLAMNFLSQICGATIILCSATQPCFYQTHHPMLGQAKQLVPYQPQLWSVFERTKIIYDGSRKLKEFPAYIEEKLQESDSLLMVCNTKQQARFLYQQMRQEGVDCFHLSASMCVQHRRDVLSQIESALKQAGNNGRKVLCISTQLIEAGVDISFGCVIRMVAGMDNAVQAAGRGNRNGERQGQAPVYLVNCSDEKLGRLPEIQAAKTATLQLLSEFEKDSQRFDHNLASEKSIAFYYHNLYDAMPEGSQDYGIEEGTTLFDLLSVNDKYANEFYDEMRFGLKQAFHLAGSRFQVFSQETTDILVPYGKGISLIESMNSEKFLYQPSLQKKILEQAKSYTISVYHFQQEQLERQGALISMFGGSVLVLDSSFYDSETGLTPEPGTMEYLGV